MMTGQGRLGSKTPVFTTVWLHAPQTGVAYYLLHQDEPCITTFGELFTGENNLSSRRNLCHNPEAVTIVRNPPLQAIYAHV